MDPFVGEIRMFAGNYAPVGWSFCFGQLLNIADNQALYALIGNRFGGDGITNFGLPDLRGRVPIHYGAGPGLTHREIGQTLGMETETLDISQMPQHKHQILANSTPTNYGNSPAAMVLAKSPAEFHNYTTDITTSVSLNSSALADSGNSLPHENIMPVQVLTFIISLTGIFPQRND